MEKPSDPLTAVLRDVRVSCAFYAYNDLGAPWAILMSPQAMGAFHFVIEGSCCLRLEGEITRLHAGDFAFVPHGRGHLIADQPSRESGTPFDEVPRAPTGPSSAAVRFGGAGARTLLVCGGVELGSPRHPLVDLLPPLIFVDRKSGDDADLLAATLHAMALEARKPRACAEGTIARFCELVVIQAIRGWFAADLDHANNWLSALRDEQVGRAIALLHGDVRRAWTNASVARAVGMSRAAFARRFKALVGAPPIDYLAQLRMQRARLLLRDGTMPLGEIAAQTGYGSDSAFSRAFKRLEGVTPREYREGAQPLGIRPSSRSMVS
jgi:AraC-like DNA-binding protein